MSVHKPLMYGTLMHLVSEEGLLMVKKPEKGKDPNSGYYTAPGGKLEKNEKGLNLKGRLERAITETQEETGITPLDPIFRGIIIFDNHGRNFSNWPDAPDYAVYVFSATKHSGNLLEEGDGNELPCWMPNDRVHDLPRNPGDKKMYEWLNSGKNFVGVIKHDGEALNESETFVEFFD